MTYMKLSDVINYFNDVLKTPAPYFIINFEQSENYGFQVISTDQIKQVIGAEDFRRMQCDVVSYIDIVSKYINIDTKPVVDYVQILKDEYVKEWLKFIENLSERDSTSTNTVYNLLLKFGVTREEILELQDKNFPYEGK